MADEEAQGCIRCGEGPLHYGHLEGTSGIPVLFWADPGKRAAAGVRVWMCRKCGYLQMFADTEKIDQQLDG